MAASGSSSSIQARPSWAPNCEHGLPCDMLTLRTARNPSQRFFRCQVRELDDCEFFEWVDGPTAHNYCRNHCVRILQVERDNYERLLRGKDETIGVLHEEMKMKTEDCELLKGKLEVALEKIEVYTKWGCVAIAAVVLVILYIVMFG